MKKVFPERLQQLQNGKTQREFAKKLGVPLTSYTNWILGVSLPNLEYVRKICHSTGVSADWLLGLSEQKRSVQTSSQPIPERGLSAADPHSETYLDKSPPPAKCQRCETLEAQVTQLVEAVHNLSVGRSQPAPKRGAEPVKY